MTVARVRSLLCVAAFVAFVVVGVVVRPSSASSALGASDDFEQQARRVVVAADDGDDVAFGQAHDAKKHHRAHKHGHAADGADDADDADAGDERLLYLLRHAKSSWANDALSDHARPLARKGREQVPLVGRWLEHYRMAPRHALVSDAVRAEQTYNLVAPHLAAVLARRDTPPVLVRHTHDLYAASASTILDTVHRLGDDRLRSLMVVAHNPGIEELAALLAAPASSQGTDARRLHWRATLDTGGMGTADLIVLRFPRLASWRALRAHTGVLLAHVHPIDLLHADNVDEPAFAPVLSRD